MKRILIFIVLALIYSGCKNKEQRYNHGFCSIGTEELNTAMANWSYYYKKEHPSGMAHDFIHEGRGSLVAVLALSKEICDIGAMSAPMDAAQIDIFVKKYGQRPVAIPVAIEALTIAANKSLPIDHLNEIELKLLFGNTPANWDIVAGQRPQQFPDSQIKACGLNSASDRYQWFRQVILEGKYGDRILELSSPQLISDSLNSGACQISYLRPLEINPQNTKMIGWQLPDQKKVIEANTKDIQDGSWPLSRYFYIYLPPMNQSGRVSVATIDFTMFILGDKAQQSLRALGLYALDKQSRNESISLLEDYRNKVIQDAESN